MSINRETVEYVAHLARIELRQDELDIFCAQLKDILGFIDTLSELNTQDVAPTSHILPVSNVLRFDEPQPSLPVDAALVNAPLREGNFFGVPRIIE
jgi:aspartyl-tRNA(Asn)/glutamyl-tRNA(Gln) amidotransferase subunit C